VSEIIERFDEMGNVIYYRDSEGNEEWREYDEKNNVTHYRDSDNGGCEEWYEYDEDGNCTHYRNREGFEIWREFDAKGNCTHFRNNKGYSWGTPREEKGVERPRLYVHDRNGGIKGRFRAATPHEILLAAKEASDE